MSVQSDAADLDIPALHLNSDSDREDDDSFFPLEADITNNIRTCVHLNIMQPLQQSQDPTLASFMLTTVELYECMSV